jgi:prepilin-type N-terminal cleavage/methylation domain-containing protein
MTEGSRARGMTLLELLVVIAIVGALCCMLMPAAQSARETARQVQCKNNLKQMALALHSYEGSWNVFPPSPLWWSFGTGKQRYAGAVLSVHTMILPDIEQGATFNAINFSAAPTNLQSLAEPGINETAACAVISAFLCPSDSASIPEPYGPTNYRANLGDCAVCGGRPSDFRNGAFNRRGTRPADFTDGLSATIALSEKLLGGAPVGVYTPLRDWIYVGWPGGSPVEISADAWGQYCAGLSLSNSLPYVKFDGGRTWMIGATEYTGFTTAVTPNSAIPDCGDYTDGGVGVFAARSFHPGTVHVAMADASVRSVRSSVSLPVWRALGTRAHGELVSASAY